MYSNLPRNSFLAWQWISIPVTKKNLIGGIANGKNPDGSFFVDYPIKEGLFVTGINIDCQAKKEFMGGGVMSSLLNEGGGVDVPGINLEK